MLSAFHYNSVIFQRLTFAHYRHLVIVLLILGDNVFFFSRRKTAMFAVSRSVQKIVQLVLQWTEL